MTLIPVNKRLNYILHLETATALCSVALASEGKLISKFSISQGFKHAENLMPLCDQLIKESGISYNDLKAVAVSAGPGSYTGLRIGVSTAKGICYGLSTPLITVPTLGILARVFKDANPDFKGLIAPMIDARRMEVYTSVFDSELNQIMAETPLVIDKLLYSDYLIEHKIAFIGDGAEKCKEILSENENAIFAYQADLDAAGMIDYAFKAFNKKNFADLAYFEPEYLKPYQGTPPPAGINAGKKV
ncbi:MAG: tRNA (adenosine(37)-N6)-threonylcarbamoyltransferase complex dimerization subunit type 1 TsaB [Bacteroidia bacterium]